MSKDIIKENLEDLVGEAFDYDNIICCFEDVEENIYVNKIEGRTSNFDEHGLCYLYNAYADIEDSTIYNIYVSVDENLIIHIS